MNSENERKLWEFEITEQFGEYDRQERMYVFGTKSEAETYARDMFIGWFEDDEGATIDEGVLWNGAVDICATLGYVYEFSGLHVHDARTGDMVIATVSAGGLE